MPVCSSQLGPHCFVYLLISAFLCMYTKQSSTVSPSDTSCIKGVFFHMNYCFKVVLCLQDNLQTVRVRETYSRMHKEQTFDIVSKKVNEV